MLEQQRNNDPPARQGQATKFEQQIPPGILLGFPPLPRRSRNSIAIRPSIRYNPQGARASPQSGPIASLRVSSLWTFPHIRRIGSPGGCGYCRGRAHGQGQGPGYQEPGARPRPAPNGQRRGEDRIANPYSFLFLWFHVRCSYVRCSAPAVTDHRPAHRQASMGPRRRPTKRGSQASKHSPCLVARLYV